MATYAGRYAEALLLEDGTLAKGVLVTVHVAGTSTLATLYADHTRTILISNPVMTDPASGMLDFYADPGLYDLTAATEVVYAVPVVPDAREYADLDASGRVPYARLPVGTGPGTVAAADDPRIIGAAGYTVSGGTWAWRAETMHRLWAGSYLTLSPGSVLVGMFTADVTLSTGLLTTFLVGGASAGVTTARMGLYLVDSAGSNLVCIGRTAADPTLWGGTEEICSRRIVDNGASSPTSISTVSLIRGSRYGFAVFVDTLAEAGPTLAGTWLGANFLSGMPPVLAYSGPAGDMDLRPSYAIGALTFTGAVVYGAATP
ncbi:hypothetical protein [Frankia sp. AvcI1]|uniref:hypothetical protein n=1 Tax=Frankia sp. AvcI1 TaxID=573496 RepID=UPI0021179424|nr:hypothetical protein [Frankia sp. AvcI1]